MEQVQTRHHVEVHGELVSRQASRCEPARTVRTAVTTGNELVSSTGVFTMPKV